MSACETCAHVRRDVAGALTCHRYPPQVSVLLVPTPQRLDPSQPPVAMQAVPLFPSVKADESCGEFRPRLALT